MIEATLLGTTNLGDRAADRSAKGKLRPLAVDKEGLPDRYFATDVDLKRGAHVGIIPADKRGSADHMRAPDFPVRLSIYIKFSASPYCDLHCDVVSAGWGANASIGVKVGS